MEGVGLATFGRPPTGPDVGVDLTRSAYSTTSFLSESWSNGGAAGSSGRRASALPPSPPQLLLYREPARYQGFVGEWSCSGGALRCREDPLLYHETRTLA